MPAHKHAELMRLYAEDALETDKPWTRWERFEPSEEIWRECSSDMPPCWYTGFEYRRKPSTITINGRELVAPERVAPEQGAQYWVLTLEDDLTVGPRRWENRRYDKLWLDRGYVFLRKEDAEAVADAILSALMGD